MTPARGLGVLAALVAVMFFDVLLAPGARVVGADSTDLALHFLHWRRFGFGELAQGNLALWNPHIFGGAPFFGGFQSALLYPPNWLFLALPLSAAANLSIALNVWLLGAFMYLWGLRRSLHPFAALLAAALVMFGAPHFLRVYAGHLAGLAAMAWVPLIFCALDEWLATRSRRWLLVGTAAVAMQIFAGHPQTVYLTGVGAGLYGLIRIFSDANRLSAATGLAAIFLGGALLAAVQLLTGMQATAETVRDRPVAYEFAVYFSFPPENLLTLLAPGFFGDVGGQPYWGRWYLWEASAYMGVLGLVLAVYGIATTRIGGKTALLVTAAAATLISFGDNTPLMRPLFDWLPWFDRLRGSAKFFFIAAVILALFAGCGLDQLLRQRTVSRRAVWIAGAVALAATTVLGVLMWIDWNSLARAVLASGQTYIDHARYSDQAFVAAARRFALTGLGIGAATLVVAAALLAWMRREPRAVFVAGALAIAEVLVFARLHRPTFDSTNIVIAPLRQYLAQHPGDYRSLNLVRPNSAMSMNAFDAWGYDPGVTRRYAEFVQWSAGADPDAATIYVNFREFHPLLTMLRVKYVITADGDTMSIHPGVLPPLRRLELIGAHQVRSGRAAILQALGDRNFDPRKQVILEREPVPAPVPALEQGRATILREGTDYMEIEAHVGQPSVLLITDAWTPAWRAVAIEAGDARRYEVMPANYALRAIPLAPGRHHLRLEYAPRAFLLGALVSLLGWVAWLGLAWREWKGVRGA